MFFSVTRRMLRMSARLLTRFMHPADGADGKEEEEDDGGWPSAACPPVMPAAAAAERAWSLRFPREALLYCLVVLSPEFLFLLIFFFAPWG
jgi:hypothetical protein